MAIFRNPRLPDPAVACYFLFGKLATQSSKNYISLLFALMAEFRHSIERYLGGDFSVPHREAFLPAAKQMVAAHVPLRWIAGFVTATCVGLLKEVKP